ncbi:MULTISPECIES: hypothetical protein [Pseudomonas]|uniref:Uncharacterized protein n=1 Tax=Pseudomonas mosselii TaxID=78327 RepID=A0ABX9BAH7_9PSED|nr:MULTISPECIES: hypothetical protein [Pseudomonas putida group]OAS08552.1 hypothetical protein AYO08_08225 [Pseudomonas putida]QZP28729.1 hypothetical protein K5H97_10435 [Pseudomonas mosselii]
MDDLMDGERLLRRLLWALFAIQPGDPKAIPLLQELDLVERDLGAVAESCRHILSRVKTSTRISGREIVDVQSIPTPWRERFAQASIGSTRLAAGPYRSDLEKFVEEWEREVIHIRAHRHAMRSV